MKILIITLIFLAHFMIPLKSNEIIVENLVTIEEEQELGILYDELGTVSTEISEDEYIEVTIEIYKKRIDERSQKSFRSFDATAYRYSVVGISNSEFMGELTSTWLYGFWVKVNGVLITKPLYPRGKDLMIYTTETILHTIETEEENPKFNVGWVESIYEPKIIK